MQPPFERFRALVHGDEALADALFAVNDTGEFVKFAVRLAAERGIVLIEDDVLQAFGAGRAALRATWA